MTEFFKENHHRLDSSSNQQEIYVQPERIDTDVYEVGFDKKLGLPLLAFDRKLKDYNLRSLRIGWSNSMPEVLISDHKLYKYPITTPHCGGCEEYWNDI